MNKTTPEVLFSRGPLALTALALAATVLAACGGASASGGTAKAATTATGVKAAKWGKNVTATYTSTKVRLKSNGLPNHSRDAQYALPNTGVVVPTASTAHIVNDPTKATSFDYSIPLKPTWSTKTTATPLGSIGPMISGSVLFNPYEGDGSTVAMASNFSLAGTNGTRVWFVDSCAGHPGPDGWYHYHGLPGCVTSQVDTATGPSHIIGLAFDGYPIYGQRDIHGKTVALSSLDKCNGINSATPEFPKGTYHYILTTAASAQSSIRCFHGKVDKSLLTTMPNMGGGGPPGGGPPSASISSAGIQAVARSAATRLFCHLDSVL